MSIDYKSAGVDREAGYEEVKKIKKIVQRTMNSNVLSSIGGFSGLFRLPIEDYKEPVMVSGTDGVGTKLKLAFMMDKHDTIGQDCVAMCVNDILCQGARPLFFLDYIATGLLDADKMASVVEGVAEGCVLSEMALIGGETAEMPGFYNEDEYDMAGFAVGVVEKSKIIDGTKIKEGDIVLSLPSSGVHSNGFSLIRKIIFEKMGFDLNQKFDKLDKTLGEELLTPTKIYHHAVKAINAATDVHGYIHITGGGLYENIPRIVPEGLCANIDLKNHTVPEIFNLLKEWGGVTTLEMYSTFNMGMGLIAVFDKDDLEAVKAELEKAGEEYEIIGEIVKGEEKINILNLPE